MKDLIRLIAIFIFLLPLGWIYANQSVVSKSECVQSTVNYNNTKENIAKYGFSASQVDSTSEVNFYGDNDDSEELRVDFKSFISAILYCSFPQEVHSNRQTMPFVEPVFLPHNDKCILYQSFKVPLLV